MFLLCSYSVPSYVPTLSSLLCYMFPVFPVYACRAHEKGATYYLLTYIHKGFRKRGGTLGTGNRQRRGQRREKRISSPVRSLSPVRTGEVWAEQSAGGGASYGTVQRRIELPPREVVFRIAVSEIGACFDRFDPQQVVVWEIGKVASQI